MLKLKVSVHIATPAINNVTSIASFHCQWLNLAAQLEGMLQYVKVILVQFKQGVNYEHY